MLEDTNSLDVAHMFFMQESGFAINYLNKKFFVPLSTFCDTFWHIIK